MGLLQLLELVRKIRAAIEAKDLDKIGDVLKEIGAAIGYGPIGTAVDGMLDALAAGRRKGILKAAGALYLAVIELVPDDVAEGGGIILVGANAKTAAEMWDEIEANIEDAAAAKAAAGVPPVRPEGIPIAVWLMILQGFLKLWELWKDRK